MRQSLSDMDCVRLAGEPNITCLGRAHPWLDSTIPSSTMLSVAGEEGTTVEGRHSLSFVVRPDAY